MIGPMSEGIQQVREERMRITWSQRTVHHLCTPWTIATPSHPRQQPPLVQPSPLAPCHDISTRGSSMHETGWQTLPSRNDEQSVAMHRLFGRKRVSFGVRSTNTRTRDSPPPPVVVVTTDPLFRGWIDSMDTRAREFSLRDLLFPSFFFFLSVSSSFFFFRVTCNQVSFRGLFIFFFYFGFYSFESFWGRIVSDIFQFWEIDIYFFFSMKCEERLEFQRKKVYINVFMVDLK